MSYLVPKQHSAFVSFANLLVWLTIQLWKTDSDETENFIAWPKPADVQYDRGLQDRILLRPSWYVSVQSIRNAQH